MLWITVCCAVILLYSPKVTHSARILGIFAHIGKSHFDVFEPMLKALAERGHEVVVASHFPLEKPIPRYTDISLKGSIPNVTSVGMVSIGEAMALRGVASNLMLAYIAPLICDHVLRFPPMQELIASDQHFDLIITELFNTDCFLGFVHKFKAPFIALSSSILMPWASDRFGNPDHPAYIPIMFEPHSDRMNFVERLKNTVYYILQKITYKFMFNWPAEKIARQYFGDLLPPLSEIAKNTSLILVNSHFTINRPRPYVPAVIEVAGLHIKPVRKLPQDLQDFLDGAKDGVIYFSMGSLLRADSLHDDKREALVAAFSEVPQRVLWKWEGKVLLGQPANVKIAKWMPQFDILNHPNVRVFMGHGGQLGIIEAVHCGVPVVGIPMVGDQDNNVRSLEEAGMALRLSYSDITKESMLTALRTVISNPSYRENAKRVSRAYHDRPMKPMDTAIFWTEYVLRHKGAPHLRSAAVDLCLSQYLLLDVLAVLVGSVVIVLCVVFIVARKILSLVCPAKASREKKLHKH